MTPLGHRPLPRWWSDAGLGILVHWGPYSVPAWAPVGPDPATVAEAEGWEEALRRVPYAEWYWNGLALEGSAVAAHHAAAHPGTTYATFAKDFGAASATLPADTWADLFARAGAGYVVLTAKHHDGYLLWDASTGNPGRGRAWQADVDLVGEVASAVRRRGMRFGVYYSGGLDWTFSGLGAGSLESLRAAVPADASYAGYVQGHWHELVERFRPDILWNDVHHPGGAVAASDLFARYYEAVPDGVVNDRFDLLGTAAGTTHADVTTPEHRALDGAGRRAFEVCRPLGSSYGWNRAEQDEDLVGVEGLVDLLVDARSRGGNLLLGVGPTAHGSIPRLQRRRLEGLAAWMGAAGEAVVGVRPWDLPFLPAADGRLARATTAAGSLFLTVCGTGTATMPTLAIPGLALPAGHDVHVVGRGPVEHRISDGALVVDLPDAASSPPVLRITPTPDLRVPSG